MSPGRKLSRRPRKPDLRIKDILKWADAHHARTGQWPRVLSGTIRESPWDTWETAHRALYHRTRGLSIPDSSLARLLSDYRGVRNMKDLPRFERNQVLGWADAHQRRTGDWPTHLSGPIRGAPGETWMAVHRKLSSGGRGLPGGSSLARLLARHRGVRNHMAVPTLRTRQILAWADAYQRRTGRWPKVLSGAIADAPGETWNAVESALRSGVRGLPGGLTLAAFLAEHRGLRNRKALPPFTRRQILDWADAHHERTGRWPNAYAGAIREARGETWAAVCSAMHQGARGLPGGETLAQLLAKQRGVRNIQGLPRHSIRRILAWADAHRRRIGRWPSQKSGPISEAPGESWRAVELALSKGLRGLHGGSSIAKLLREHRSKRNPAALPPLSKKRLIAWAEAHHRRTRRWPTLKSGRIPGTIGETWLTVDKAVRNGRRGLRSRSSLARLLAKHRRGRV